MLFRSGQAARRQRAPGGTQDPRLGDLALLAGERAAVLIKAGRDHAPDANTRTLRLSHMSDRMTLYGGLH